MIQLEDVGARSGPEFDCTPALNVAALNAWATGDPRIVIGPGDFFFKSRPMEFTKGIRLAGVSKFHTRLFRDYDVASPNEGFLTFRELKDPDLGTTRSSAVMDMAIACTGASNGGSMIVATTDGPVTGFLELAGLKVSHNNLGGSYQRALLIDGRANQLAGGQGYRDVNIRDCFFFAAPGGQSVQFMNVTNMTAQFFAQGTVLISGAPVPYGHSTYGTFDLLCLDQVTVDNADLVLTRGYVRTFMHGAGASRCKHAGPTDSYTNLGAVSNAHV